MAPLTGQRHTANVAATQRVIDLHEPILELEPSATPLTVWTSRINREKAADKKFTWHNDSPWQRWDALDDVAGSTSTDTTLVVDNGNRFTADDTVKVPRTGEVILVVSISTDTLTVVRGAGSSTAAALVDDDPLLIYATAAEEGSLPRAARSDNPVVETNYTEIFKRTTEASGTWLSSSNESSPHDWPFQARKDMREHQKDKEYAFLFGAPGVETGANGKDQTLTGGLLYYLTSNNVAAGGAWTLTEISAFIQSITRYGSKRKVLFTGRTANAVLSAHSLSKIQTKTGESRFGVAITEWLDANGTLEIVPHPLLEGAIYDGYAIAVDFAEEAVGYRYLNGNGPGGGRDTHVETNVEEPGRDGRRDQIIAEVGLRVGLPQTGGVTTGITSAA